MKSEKYNGWKNYETWNVALWLNNDEYLHNKLVKYATKSRKPTYTGFIQWADLVGDSTGDGVSYINSRISRTELSRDLFDGLLA